MVEVQNVTKRYGGRAVVDAVTVNIPRGKITSLIGPNGAGKSTLLSMISRLVPKDEGEIRIDGRELTSVKNNELAKKLSILKQSNHLQIRLKVRELVSFGRFPYSRGRLTKEDWLHVDRAIEYMELEDLQDRFLDQLSGGQRQRAFIAMVLAQDTEYVLLDEPLNNLDMKHAVQIMRITRSLANDLGKTVVLVLHDVNFASAYSDHIVALKDGRVAAAGTPDELIRSDVLGDIYEMQIPIETVGGCRVCIYFTGEQAAAL